MNTQEFDIIRVAERLREKGFLADDIEALEKEPEELARAAPLLLELLSEVSSFKVKEDLVRAASKAPVPPQPLIEELRRLRPQLERDVRPSASLSRLKGADLVAELRRIRTESTGASSLGWALGDALEKRADASIFEDLVDLLRDNGLGKSRQMLPYALAKIESRRNEAIVVLVDVLDDKDLTAHAIDALAQMRAIGAIQAIRPFLESEDRLVKSEARKALKKLGERGTSRTESPSQQQPLAPDGLTEASTNFDLEQIRVLLQQLAAVVDGFGPSEIEHIESHLLEMKPEEQESFDFRVQHAGEEVPLHIRIFMSDIGAPHVGFFSTPKLAATIDRLMDDLEE